MIKFALLFILVINIFSQVTEAKPTKEYFRKDYTYIPATQSFYKLHNSHRTWQDAKKRCVLEGARLYFPEDKNEMEIVADYWNKTSPTLAHIFVGISDLISTGDYETIDGRPVDEVYNVWGDGEPNNSGGIEHCAVLRLDGTMNDDSCNKSFFFICKKTLDSLEYNTICDTHDPKYLYSVQLNKCYKFSEQPRNWTDAYAACKIERSYLAIIDNQDEADYLAELTARSPKDYKGDYLRGYIHLGFENRDGDGWKTVKGTALEDTGYTTWGDNQPDNAGGSETCGSMLHNAKLNDVTCNQQSYFICEHDLDQNTITC